jgi:hypothetical protein
VAQAGGFRVATRPSEPDEDDDVLELDVEDVVDGCDSRVVVSVLGAAERSVPSDRSLTGGFRVAVRSPLPDDAFPLLSPLLSVPRELDPLLDDEPLGL